MEMETKEQKVRVMLKAWRATVELQMGVTKVEACVWQTGWRWWDCGSEEESGCCQAADSEVQGKASVTTDQGGARGMEGAWRSLRNDSPWWS